MSMNRTLSLKLEHCGANVDDQPIVPGGRSLSKRGRKKWKGDVVHKQRGSAAAASKARDRLLKGARAGGKKK